MLKITLLCWMIFCSGIFCSSESSDEEFFPTKIQNSRCRFTLQEDKKLIKLAPKFNNDWKRIASYLPGRSPRQCRERWTNYLKPEINSKIDTRDLYDKEIESLYAKYGPKWSLIALCVFGSEEYATRAKDKWMALQKRQRTKKSFEPKLDVPVNSPLENKILQQERNDEFLNIANVLPEPICLDPNHSEDCSSQPHVPSVSFGLSNLGNTCFLSSAIQGMRYCPFLNTFFATFNTNKLSREQKEFLKNLNYVLNSPLQILNSQTNKYKKSIKMILLHLNMTLGEQHDPAEFLNRLLNLFSNSPTFGKKLSIIPYQGNEVIAAENWPKMWKNASKYKLTPQKTNIININTNGYQNFSDAFLHNFQENLFLQAPDVLIVKQCYGSTPNSFQGLLFPKELQAFSNASTTFHEGTQYFFINGLSLFFQNTNTYIFNGGIATQRGLGNNGHYIAFVPDLEGRVIIYDDDQEIVISENDLLDWCIQNDFHPYIGFYSKIEEINTNVGVLLSSLMDN